MADRIEIDTAALAKAAALPEQVSGQVKAVIDTLHTTLTGLENDSANQPWGNDKSGKKFAGGDKGYKATRDNLVNSGYGMADALHQFAEGERTAAESFDTGEDGSTTGFGGS